jgi:hypothetical protein
MANGFVAIRIDQNNVIVTNNPMADDLVRTGEPPKT